MVNLWALACVVSTVAIVALQLRLSKDDLGAAFFLDLCEATWCIHHDEKLLAADARAVYLRRPGMRCFEDYKPYPATSCFGVGGTFLHLVGMWLFGMNSRGLRAPFILVSAVQHLLVLSLCLQAAPPVLAVPFYLAYLLNYNLFILTFHGILENVLTCCLLGLLVGFAFWPQGFVDNAPAIAAGIGILVLFKPSFPMYAFLLVAAILSVATASLWPVVEAAFWFVLGIVSFELFHFWLLSRQGIAQWRLINLLYTLRSHMGGDLQLLQSHFRPKGLRIFPLVASCYGRWVLGQRTAARRHTGAWFHLSALLLAGALGLGAWLSLYAGASPLPLVLSLFIMLYLASLSLFFFYLKRLISILPFLHILALFNLEELLRLVPGLGAALCLALGAVFPVLLWLQFRDARLGFSQKNSTLARNSARLDELVPLGASLYMHCYAFRFAWQAQNPRMISADDQFLDNSLLLNYVCFQKPVEPVYIMVSANPALVPQDRLKGYAFIEEFSSTAAVSDYPIVWRLYKGLPLLASAMPSAAQV